MRKTKMKYVEELGGIFNSRLGNGSLVAGPNFYLMSLLSAKGAKAKRGDWTGRCTASWASRESSVKESFAVCEFHPHTEEPY